MGHLEGCREEFHGHALKGRFSSHAETRGRGEESLERTWLMNIA
jgi:hypothetical protein